MPGATPRGYPYPLGTEPADGSANIEALARAVDGDMTAQQLKGAGGVLVFRKTSGFTAGSNMPLPYTTVESASARFSEVASGDGTSAILILPGLYFVGVRATVSWSGGSMTVQGSTVRMNTQSTVHPVIGYLSSVTGAFTSFSAGLTDMQNRGLAMWSGPAMGGAATAVECMVSVFYLGGQ